jgi:hypothetical protein
MWYRKAKRMVEQNGFERMAAAGMGRLLSHMLSGPYAIISADRAGMTPEERDSARAKLKNTLRSLGYGFVKTKGAWREDTGEYSHEGSVFVPGITPEMADLLGRELNQDSVIVGDGGKFRFLNPKGFDWVPEGEFDLASTLRIPELSASPEMYTQLGKRKFELRLEDDPLDTFSRGRIEQLREQLGRMPRTTIQEPGDELTEQAFVAHAYIGNPPLMMPKFGVRLAGTGELTGNLQITSAMVYCVPFAAKLRELLPEFHPSPHWGEPLRRSGVRTAGVMDVADFVPGESGVYEDALANVAGFHGGVADLFSTQKPGQNMKSFDSLYVGPSGNIFMLQPHSHDETARRVLRTVHPELPAIMTEGRVAGGYTHTDLTQASGIQRIQIYRDGVGVTVEMSRPPNGAQLNTIRDAYTMTPMGRFIAEITLNGELLTHLTSFGQLVHFVNNWDPDDPSSVEVLDPRLGELYDRRLAD